MIPPENFLQWCVHASAGVRDPGRNMVVFFVMAFKNGNLWKILQSFFGGTWAGWKDEILEHTKKLITSWKCVTADADVLDWTTNLWFCKKYHF